MVFTQNRQQICTRALKICGAIGKGQSPLQQDMNDASDALNLAIADISNQGFNLMQIEQVTLRTQTSSTVSGYRCIKSHTAAAANQPGSGDTWQEYWFEDSTITGAAWVSGTSYLSAGDFTCSVDTKEITNMHIRLNQNDYPIQIIDYAQYSDIPSKWQTGQPIQAWIDYKSTPVVYLYYIPDQTYTLNYFKVTNPLSMDTASSSPQYQSRWWNALTFKTAQYLSYVMQLPSGEKDRIQLQAERLLSEARSSEFKTEQDNISRPSYNN